jgi:hypothetical protein
MGKPDERYHEGCFSCVECGKGLLEFHWIVGRKVLCEKHARSYERMGRGEEERDRRAQKRQTIVTRR